MEVVKRLREGLGRPQIVEGDGGIWGQWGRSLPCVHVYEQTEETEQIKPGLYQALLPVRFEYINKLSDRKRLFSEGREKLHAVQQALELDERLKSSVTEQDLVITYDMRANEILELLDSTFCVILVYNFVYADSFLGYESNRH